MDMGSAVFKDRRDGEEGGRAKGKGVKRVRKGRETRRRCYSGNDLRGLFAIGALVV